VRTIDRSQLPDWTEYVVVLWSNQAAAPFRTIEAAAECVTELGIAFACEVIRVRGDVLVWPIHAKGGTA
jgi:hypothetical protein